MSEAPSSAPDLEPAGEFDPLAVPAPAEQVDKLYRAAWALCGSSVTAQALVRQAYAEAPLGGGALRRRDPLIGLLRAVRDAHVELDSADDERPRRASFDASGVYAAVAALPERYREALIAVDIVGLSHRDGAVSLEMTPTALASRLLRAREHLARALTNDIAHLARTESVMGALTPEEEGELAAFADGSALRDRDAVAARVGRSPELAALVDDQHQALAALARVQHQAPERLRSSLPSPSVTRARRAGGTIPLLLALAGVVILAAIALRSGSSATGPTLDQVAALAARGANTRAPSRSTTAHGALAIALDNTAFPDLGPLHWRAGGSRLDVIKSRTARSVFYRETVVPHSLVTYTILSGKPLPPPHPATAYVRNAIHVESFSSGTRNIVVWQRGDHTCMLSGAGIPTATLLRLATYRPH